MQTTVKSKFSTWFLIKIGLFALLLVIIIISSITLAIKNQPDDLSLMIGFSILLFLFFAYWIVTNFVTIVAAPEELTLNYRVINRKTVIDYGAIVHIRNTQRARVKSTQEFDYSDPDVRLEIELNNGKIVSINAEPIANYDELKEAIRRFRFGLV